MAVFFLPYAFFRFKQEEKVFLRNWVIICSVICEVRFKDLDYVCWVDFFDSSFADKVNFFLQLNGWLYGRCHLSHYDSVTGSYCVAVITCWIRASDNAPAEISSLCKWKIFFTTKDLSWKKGLMTIIAYQQTYFTVQRWWDLVRQLLQMRPF